MTVVLTAMSSRNRIMRFLFLRMKGLTTSIHGSLAPNSTKLAKFCRHLATRMRLRDAVSDGVSLIRLNCLGFKMAGQRSLKKINPLQKEVVPRSKPRQDQRTANIHNAATVLVTHLSAAKNVCRKWAPTHCYG